MKSLKVILTSLMIALVMVASTNFMVGIHFCMGDVQQISLFTATSGCEMQAAVLPACHQHLQEPCCDDETVLHESDDFSSANNVLSIVGPDILLVAALPVIVSEVIPGGNADQKLSIHYVPPLRSPDIIVEHRSLLI